ncbi:MAG: geranylgeranyl reductase family protein [Myxococcales bacterium]|nr:geranylgeranyl reductase family protein [Myxococcales bacterium]
MHQRKRSSGSDRERYDLLVVGAGPAGCAAGIEAARAGLRVGVLDRATFPRAKTCGDAVSNRGAALVDALVGRPDALRTVPHAEVRAGAAVFPDGSRVVRRFDDAPGFIVPRLHLDDLLRRALEAAGAELRQGVAVRRLEREGDRVAGAIADGLHLRADVVVAADGPGSVAWAALGVPYRRGIHLGVAITAYHEGVDHHGAPDTNEHYFEPDLRGGYGWIFPAVDGLSNLGVYQRADRFAAHDATLPELLQRFVERHPERLGGSRPLGRARRWALPLMSRPWPPAGPGVLTCGDAAWSIDPLSGEGIFQALHTGRLAGRAAARALAHGGLDRLAARRYQLACAASLGPTSLGRLAIQEGMDHLVAHRWYRHPWIRRAIDRGYGSEAFEVSKRVS